jgi:hypothetical protein
VEVVEEGDKVTVAVAQPRDLAVVHAVARAVLQHQEAVGAVVVRPLPEPLVVADVPVGVEGGGRAVGGDEDAPAVEAPALRGDGLAVRRLVAELVLRPVGQAEGDACQRLDGEAPWLLAPRGADVHPSGVENPPPVRVLRPPAPVGVVEGADARLEVLIDRPLLLDVEGDGVAGVPPPADVEKRQAEVQAPVVEVDRVEIAQGVGAGGRAGGEPGRGRPVGGALSSRGRGRQHDE